VRYYCHVGANEHSLCLRGGTDLSPLNTLCLSMAVALLLRASSSYMRYHFYRLTTKNYIKQRKSMIDNQYDALAATVRIKDITSSGRNRALLHRIKNNDPSLTSLSMDYFDYDGRFIPREGDDLGWLGYFIGRNETLTNLYLRYLPGGREQAEKFFIGMQYNKSIKDVEIWGDYNLNEGFAVMNFPHVATMTLDCDRPLERENAHYFALGLRRCKSLKKYTGPVIAEIVAGLSALPALESMYLWVDGELVIRRVECVALRELLANASQLKRLDLSHCGLGDDELEILAEGLASNSSLNDGLLDLSNNNIGDRGVQALASSLASNGMLLELHLSNNIIGDKGLEMLAAGLIHNRALRVLSISGNTAITDTGVRAISRILQSRTTSGLEKLRLDRINLGDGGGKILADALSINKSLVSLSLLCVGGMSIGNEGLRALSVGLSRNSTLRELDLSGNTAITAAGLHSLKWYFRSPLCALETLFIKSINFGDKGAYALADALARNKSLKRLLFSEGGITSKGWKAFLKFLCDTSSPNSLYLSNHTLTELGGWGPTRAGSVRQSITTWLGKNNECDTRNLAAKTKILHFFPDLDMMPLFQWNLKFLPLVKRWFEKITSPNDEIAAVIRNRELTAIYKFVSVLPLLVVHDFKRYYLTQPLQRIRSKISELEEGERRLMQVCMMLPQTK
jgi:Ran GTPase-activating protein (RanGAP) involved in mRNA processing and transport